VTIQFVRYFVTLAKERHFARAAQNCGVSQPTLSAGLSRLEQELGKRLIVRDRRFMSLTAEGEAVLPWAQQLLATREAMSLAAETPSGPLHGELRLGIIPAAMPISGPIVNALLAAQPEITISVRSLTSREISDALSVSEIDAGITYLDHEPLANTLSVPLYKESYLFLTHRRNAPTRDTIDLAEALDQPLCVLHQGMQNRRILDQRLGERALGLRPRATADSYVALLGMVQSGQFATIIPDSYGMMLTGLDWAVTIPFEDPLPASRIGLIVENREPLGPMPSTALSCAQKIKLPKPFISS
jgi:DNA-binding transcriptional LysR family regulator